MRNILFNLKNFGLILIFWLGGVILANAQCPTQGAVLIKTHTNISCFGANDGTITVELGDGTAPLNFELYDNNIGEPVTLSVTEINDPDGNGNFRKVRYENLYPSSFQVLVYKAGCFPSPLQITENGFGFDVQEPAPLQVTVNTIDPDCNPASGPGNADGQIDLTITGGSTPYNVTWTTSATPIAGGAYNSNPANITEGSLDGGAYTIDVVDANGCTTSQVVNVPISTPAEAGPDQLLCDVTTTNLQATPVGAGEVGTWTVVSGTGTATSINDPASGVTGLTLGASTTFRWTITDAGGLCPGNSDEVIVTVDAAPTIALAGPDQVLCNTTTSLAANTPIIGTGTWTIISGAGGSVVSVNDPASVFNGVAGQIYVLRWTIANGSCPSSTDDVQISFEGNPTVANAGPDQVVCANNTALAANTPAVGTGAWSIISGAGGTIATPSSPNSGFTGTPGETYVLRWTITNGSCPPSSDDVQIQFDVQPTVANAGPNRNICGTSHVLEANAPAVGTGMWTIVSGAGGSFVDPAVNNTTFNGVQGNTYVLRWTITNGSCPPSTDDVQIRFDAPPTPSVAGPDQTLCATNTVLAGNTPAIGTGTWTVISGAGGSFSNANDPNATFSGTAGVTYTLRWRITNGACAASDDQVVIRFDEAPTPAAAGPDQTLCATSTALAANTPVVGTGLWTIISGAGGNITTPGSPTSNFTGTAGETYVLRWTISNGTCPSTTDDVQITFDEAPTTAAAGPDQILCNTSTTLAGNVPAVGTGTWTITSGAGGTVADPASATSGFSGVAGTTYILRWTITNGTCAPSFDDVQITFEAPPTTPDAGPDQAVCGTNTNLAANAPVVGAGTWTIENGAGGLVTTPSSPVSGFTGVVGTTYTLRWTITNGSCPVVFDEVQITFDAAPDVATAGPDQTLCGTNATLAANVPAIGTGLWTIENGAGGTIADPADPASGFTGVAGTVYTLRWTITNGSCAPSFDEVTIAFDAIPTVADAGSDQTVCGTNTTLDGNAPATGTGLWTIISGTGGVIATPADPASAFTGSAGETYVLRWTISSGSCPDSFDEVQIVMDAAPTTANAGPDQSVCNTSTTLAANAPVVGTGMWSIVSGAGGSVSTPADPASTFTGVAGTTYVLRWTISSGSCPISTDDVSITFEIAPTTADAGPDQDACGTSATLAANAPVTGTGSWSIISGTGGTIADTSDPASGFSGTVGEVYVLRWTITTPCGSSTDDVQISFNDAPTAASAGPDKTICGSEALEGNTPAVGTGLWTIESGSGGSLLDPSDPATSFSGVAGSVYILRWTISNGSCAVSFDEVEITIDNNSPTVADAGLDQQVCGNTTTLEGNFPLVGTGSWSILSGAGGSIANSSDPFSDFSGTPGTAYTLRWTITSAVVGCSPTFDDVVILLEDAPSLPIAGNDQQLCGPATTLEGNTPTSGTGMWTILNGAGGVIADPSNPTSSFSGTPGTTYTLEWSISNSCGVGTDEVIIEFLDNPSVAAAGPDKTVCGPTVLEGNVPVVGTGIWTIESGTGGVLADPNDPASGFSGTGGTSYTLRWTVTSGSCAPTFDEVVITFDNDTPTPADAGADQDVCGLSTNLSGNIPANGTGTWTIVSGTGGTIDDPSLNNSGFNGLAGTTYVLQWEVTSGCGSSTDVVSIMFNDPATVADAGADRNVCGPTNLEANTPVVGTGVWSIESGTGGVLADPADPTTLFTGTPGTTYTLRWTITSGGCAPSFDDVDITFDNSSPTPADAGADQAICGTSAFFEGNTPASGTGTWTIVSGAGGTITDANDPASQFDGVAGTTYVLRWSITSGVLGCADSFDDVTIAFELAPTLADAGLDQQVCSDAVVLGANVPTSGTGTWSVSSGAGGSFDDPANPAATFTGSRGTTYVLTWTIANACGTSEDNIQIILEDDPTTPLAGDDKTVCGPTTLEGNTPTVGTGVWTIMSGAGGILADDTNPTSGFSGVAGTTYTLRWTISNGTCAPAFDEVDITFDLDTPTTADAGGDQAVCATSTALMGNTPVVGTGSWSIVSGAGGSFVDAADPVTTFDGVAGETYVLRWTIASGVSCAPSFDDVTIVFEVAPSVADAGTDQVICTTSTTLAAVTPVSGTGTWSVISGTGGTFDDENDPTTTFTGTEGETYVLQWTVENSCGSNTDDVSIQIQVAPTVADAGPDQIICGAINTTLAANAPVSGTGLWTIIGGTGGAVVTPGSPTSQFVGIAGNVYTLRWIISSGTCAPTTDDVVINLAASPSTTSPLTVCVNNAKPTLTAAATGATNFNWYYYTDASDPGTRTFLANTATGNFTPGAELDMSVVASTTYEVTAVYGCGESPATTILVDVSNTGGCGVIGGNCATVVITPVPSPATCTLSNGSIFFNIDPFTPVINNEGVIIAITGISSTNLTISRTNYNDPQFNALPIGVYEYTIVYGDSSCIKTGFVTIDQSGTVGTPVASDIVSPVCAGTATGAVTIDVPGETGNVLEWSVDGITWTSFVSGSQITGVPAGPAPTFERVISVRRNGSDPCNAVVIINIQDANPAIQISQINTTSVSTCGGNDGTLSVSGISGGSGAKQIRLFVLTSTGSELVQNYVDVTADPFVFNDLSNGSYYVEVRDELGCTTTTESDPAIISSPGAVQFTASVLANAECSSNAGKSGVVVINFDPAESTGNYQIGVSTSPTVEPFAYANYFYNQGVVDNILVDTLSRGNFFVWIKPANANVCPSVRPTGFVDGPYVIDFDVQRVCGDSDGSVSINLVNVKGDPAVSTFNIEVYRVADLSEKVDDFTGERVDDIITITYTPDGGGVHGWLNTPDQYVIKAFQLNQLFCLGERPPRTPSHQEVYTVSSQLAHVVDKIRSSYPEPRSTGGFLLKTISGGLPFTDESGTYYSVSLIDPATNAEIAGPLKIRRNTQGNYQYDFRNLPTGNYIVEVTDAFGCVSSSTVIVPADTRLLIPNIFTPNGDGVNDLFEIVNLPVGGSHRLIISNRWGKEVFSANNYQEGNFWDAEGMPEGIYFYKLDVEGDQTYNGWVEIVRGSKP